MEQHSLYFNNPLDKAFIIYVKYIVFILFRKEVWMEALLTTV